MIIPAYEEKNFAKIEDAINKQNVRIIFTLEVGGVDLTDYLLSWDISHDKQFGSASASCILNNEDGIFGEGGTSIENNTLAVVSNSSPYFMLLGNNNDAVPTINLQMNWSAFDLNNVLTHKGSQISSGLAPNGKTYMNFIMFNGNVNTVMDLDYLGNLYIKGNLFINGGRGTNAIPIVPSFAASISTVSPRRTGGSGGFSTSDYVAYDEVQFNSIIVGDLKFSSK
jgi:hypothetical protein